MVIGTLGFLDLPVFCAFALARMALARAICFADATVVPAFALVALAPCAFVVGAFAVCTFAVGAFAVCALALGAFALGALALLGLMEAVGVLVSLGAGAAFALVGAFARGGLVGADLVAPESDGLPLSAPMVSTSAATGWAKVLNTRGAGADAVCASAKTGAIATIEARITDLCNIFSFPSASLERFNFGN